jgi:murein DD-endopeptidase MepM/ murein hydrolase activator NlpD
MPDQLSGYELFTVDNTADWAYLTFVIRDETAQITAFQIALAEYHQTLAAWQIYPEGSADYHNALPRLPEWLQWLTHLETLRVRHPTAATGGTYSIIGLPWKPDSSWRYNQGPVTANHLNAFDFGVPINGVEDEVYAAEDGIVIGTNGTCIILERPSDGLRQFYQHINSSDLYQFNFGELVTYKQKIGRTTLAPGCGGTTTGHHLHFAFYAPFGGPIINPQGFTMNGWQVVGNTLVKEDEIATSNFTDTVLHDATIFYDEFDGETLSPEWFWVREDDKNWSLEERPNFLRIYTQDGSPGTTDILPNNLLLRAAMRANYELIVRFEGAFTENHHQAILTLYQDDDNYLVISRFYDDINYDGDMYTFSRKENGETAEPLFTAEATETNTALRLIVSDRIVMAFYQNENSEWLSLGHLAINGLDLYPKIGFSAYQGQPLISAKPIPIDFDAIQAQPFEMSTIYLPYIQGP